MEKYINKSEFVKTKQHYMHVAKPNLNCNILHIVNHSCGEIKDSRVKEPGLVVSKMGLTSIFLHHKASQY